MGIDDATPLEWERAARKVTTDYIDPYDIPGQDMVNHPPHYNQGSIECLKYIKDNLGPEGYSYYLDGNIKKYIHRWRYKDKIRDLEKAQFYLSELIEAAKKLAL
ncbi:MAG: hypothetical protein CL885_04145 [Dehalococcoidia bacterium]|nr:hypothetical protein [Dehalococcoidia bacterium]|tara:strand:+ start:133 stop:444 length:312 start_codon:yes stop_codon:yes gene_type:complete